MKIIGFIPSPDNAAKIVAWAIAFAQTDDDLEFLCYEINFSSHTQLAAQAALTENRHSLFIRGDQARACNAQPSLSI